MRLVKNLVARLQSVSCLSAADVFLCVFVLLSSSSKSNSEVQRILHSGRAIHYPYLVISEVTCSADLDVFSESLDCRFCLLFVSLKHTLYSRVYNAGWPISRPQSRRGPPLVLGRRADCFCTLV